MAIKMNNEAKTGILVLASALALIVMVLKVGNFPLFKKGYAVKSQFHFTAGVKKHAPVRLSGVDVGEVRDIDILYNGDTLIELELWIDEGVKLRKDSKAYVTTLGLMGEKYVEIKAGTSAAEYATEGDILPSEDPVRLEDLLHVGTEVAGDISQMANDISRVATRVDDTLAENKPRVNNIFQNFEETSGNFRDFSEDIKYHPWKILARGKEKTKEEIARDKAKKKEASL